jgi:colicin import membrane protein
LRAFRYLKNHAAQTQNLHDLHRLFRSCDRGASMKAALEAWGSRQNLFHQGLAEETDDLGIAAATLQNPDVVLRRAAGTNATFQENAAFPKSLPAAGRRREPHPRAHPQKKAKAATAQSGTGHKAAIIQFEKEKARREKQREKEDAERKRHDAAEERDNERRRRLVEKAQAVLSHARGRHEEKMAQLENDLDAVRAEVNAELVRWKREPDALEDDIRKAQR